MASPLIGQTQSRLRPGILPVESQDLPECSFGQRKVVIDQGCLPLDEQAPAARLLLAQQISLVFGIGRMAGHQLFDAGQALIKLTGGDQLFGIAECLIGRASRQEQC